MAYEKPMQEGGGGARTGRLSPGEISSVCKMRKHRYLKETSRRLSVGDVQGQGVVFLRYPL